LESRGVASGIDPFDERAEIQHVKEAHEALQSA
jgi:hypothetical protein